MTLTLRLIRVRRRTAVDFANFVQEILDAPFLVGLINLSALRFGYQLERLRRFYIQPRSRKVLRDAKSMKPYTAFSVFSKSRSNYFPKFDRTSQGQTFVECLIVTSTETVAFPCLHGIQF